MSLLVKNIYEFLENLAPLYIAESKDNNGLQVGSYNNFVSGILLTIDVTKSAILYALKMSLNLIVSHHPLIFSPLFNIIKENPKGELIHLLIKHDLNLISWHTPLDKITDGVSEAFIKALKFESSDFILKEEKFNQVFGLGRVVYLKKSIKLQDLAKRISQIIDSWIMVVGDLDSSIDSFGFCGGSGAFLKDELKKLGVYTLITSDVKYHTAKDSLEEGFNFIILDHAVSESFILPILKEKIQNTFKNIPVEIYKEPSPYKIFNFKGRG